MSEICPVCDGMEIVCTCEDPDGCRRYYDSGGCDGCNEFIACRFCGGTGEVSAAKADRHRVQFASLKW